MDDISENSWTNKMDSYAKSSKDPENHAIVNLWQKKGRISMEHNSFDDEHNDDNHYKNKYMDGIETRIPSRGTGLKIYLAYLLTIRLNHWKNPDFVSWSSKAYKSATINSYQGKIPSLKSMSKTPRVIEPDPTLETSSESNFQRGKKKVIFIFFTLFEL